MSTGRAGAEVAAGHCQVRVCEVLGASPGAEARVLRWGGGPQGVPSLTPAWRHRDRPVPCPVTESTSGTERAAPRHHHGNRPETGLRGSGWEGRGWCGDRAGGPAYKVQRIG